MTALALAQPTRLDELAATVRREHQAVNTTALTMLYHGIAAGEALQLADQEIVS